MASITKHKDRWRVQVRRRGHPPRSKIFDTRRDAERWARDQEQQLETEATVPATHRVTLADVLATYRTHATDAGATKQWLLKKLEEQLGSYRLGELTVPALTAWAVRLSRTGTGPHTLRSHLSNLGTVLRYGGPLSGAGQATAVALNELAATRASLIHTGRVGPAHERTRRPTEAELDVLVQHWADKRRQATPMAALTMFAIATCMRLGEICRIEFEDFDEGNRTIVIRDRKHPRQKKGNDHVVPLLTHTTLFGMPLDPVRIMLTMPFAPYRHGRVFPYNPDTVSQAFSSAVAANNIPDLVFHDLRHDGISRMFESGYQIQEVAVVSGHKSWSQLRRYTQISPVSLHKK